MSAHLTSEIEVKGDLVATHRKDLQYDSAEDVGKSLNALTGITKNELLQGEDSFTRQRGLEEYANVFRCGALVAQKPRVFGTLEELLPDDKTALQHEIDHKWNQTGALYFTAEFDKNVRLRSLPC